MNSIRNVPLDVASARILHYLRAHNYDDCAVYINRLNSSTFRKILCNYLSIDILIAQLPFSIEIFQVVYSKVFIYDPESFPLRILKPDKLLSKMISVFASSCIEKTAATTTSTTAVPSSTTMTSIISKTKDMGLDDERLLSNLSSILRVISYVQPILFKRIIHQKETIDECILYFEKTSSPSTKNVLPLKKSSSTSCLIPKNLEESVRQELESTITCCQQALHRLEVKSPPTKPLTAFNAMPSTARKYSTISMIHPPSSFDDIQDRLFQNQAVLNLIEPYLSRAKLHNVVDHIGYKVSIDKQILLAYSHIKTHEKQIPIGEPLLPLFKRFAFAYERIIQLWRRVTDSTLIDDCNDDIIIDNTNIQDSSGFAFVRARSRGQSGYPLIS